MDGQPHEQNREAQGIINMPDAPAPPESQRADLWLWATRFYKSRSLAAEACKGGKVRKAGQPVKPATPLRPGDTLVISTELCPREIRIEKIIARRAGAPIAVTCYTELTDPDVVAAAREARRIHVANRAPGEGRPTKQDRRQIEKLEETLRGLGYLPEKEG
jgi:ribosome-associated heat shock protein Hsp15